MKITTKHRASRYGVPVILDDGGNLLDYAIGVKEIRRRLGLSCRELGDRCGYSPRTVEGWEQGRTPTAAALNALADLLGRG